MHGPMNIKSSDPLHSYPTYLNYFISYIKVGVMKFFSMQYIRNAMLRQMEVHGFRNFKRVEGYKNQSHNLLNVSHDTEIQGKFKKERNVAHEHDLKVCLK